jgi:lipid-A-disaccharide synthase
LQNGQREHPNTLLPPQIWAWKENRITDIKKDVDKMYVILPFENIL